MRSLRLSRRGGDLRHGRPISTRRHDAKLLLDEIVRESIKPVRLTTADDECLPAPYSDCFERFLRGHERELRLCARLLRQEYNVEFDQSFPFDAFERTGF